MGMFGDVGQGFSKDCKEFVCKGVIDSGVDRPVESDDGFEPESAGGFAAELDQFLADRPTRQTGRVQLKDCRSNVSNGCVKIVYRSQQSLLDRIVRHETQRCVQAETDREETLNDRVMQVPCNSLAVLDSRKLGDPSVQAGVLDSDTRC